MFAMAAMPLAMKHWQEWHKSDQNDLNDLFEFNNSCLGLVSIDAYHLADMMIAASKQTKDDNGYYKIPQYI